MTPNQKTLREIRDKQSKARQEMGELAALDSLSDEQRTRFDELEASIPDLERRSRGAALAVESDDQAAEIETPDDTPEQREAAELRSRYSLGRAILAAGAGRVLQGAEAELHQHENIPDGAIALSAFDAPKAAPEQRDVTPAPTTGTGVNLSPVLPDIFAPSAAFWLMVDLPKIGSGTHAEAVITTSVTAAAKAKGGAVPATAGAITTKTTTPHRVGGQLEIAVEDVATIGTGNFEAALRQNLQLSLSNELDKLLLNGDSGTTAAEPDGFLKLLTAPNATAPTAGASSFAGFLAAFTERLDGIFAADFSEIRCLAGLDSHRAMAQSFRSGDSDNAFSDYARMAFGGVRSNSRMPGKTEKSNKAQAGIFVRTGKSGNPSPMRIAVCPTWNYLQVDDIYTKAGTGARVYTIHALIGDLILNYAEAYGRESFRLDA